jgi:predicted nucleic acid-binding protein
MIVADINLIVYLLSDTPQHSSAVELFQRDPDWRLPPLWRHEMLNVIATLTRHGVLDEQEAFTL